jgi:hypothetical protein
VDYERQMGKDYMQLSKKWAGLRFLSLIGLFSVLLAFAGMSIGADTLNKEFDFRHGIDYRQADITGTVKDQGENGSCFAEAALVALTVHANRVCANDPGHCGGKWTNEKDLNLSKLDARACLGGKGQKSTFQVGEDLKKGGHPSDVLNCALSKGICQEKDASRGAYNKLYNTKEGQEKLRSCELSEGPGCADTSTGNSVGTSIGNSTGNNSFTNGNMRTKILANAEGALDIVKALGGDNNKNYASNEARMSFARPEERCVYKLIIGAGDCEKNRLQLTDLPGGPYVTKSENVTKWSDKSKLELLTKVGASGAAPIIGVCLGELTDGLPDLKAALGPYGFSQGADNGKNNGKNEDRSEGKNERGGKESCPAAHAVTVIGIKANPNNPSDPFLIIRNSWGAGNTVFEGEIPSSKVLKGIRSVDYIGKGEGRGKPMIAAARPIQRPIGHNEHPVYHPPEEEIIGSVMKKVGDSWVSKNSVVGSEAERAATEDLFMDENQEPVEVVDGQINPNREWCRIAGGTISEKKSRVGENWIPVCLFKDKSYILAGDLVRRVRAQ